MTLGKEKRKELLEALASTVMKHADELTELDRVIGDADHGLNMERGFSAVLKQLDDLAVLPIGTALTEVGRTLVMAVGGASGPLFGTLFMTLGKQLGESDPGYAQLVAACDAAIAAVKTRGKSDVGQKTMLDVLVPVLNELHADGPRLEHRLRERAREAVQATVPMVAQRGRASFLGARSAGHMDPGARSTQLMVEIVCNYLERNA